MLITKKSNIFRKIPVKNSFFPEKNLKIPIDLSIFNIFSEK